MELGTKSNVIYVTKHFFISLNSGVVQKEDQNSVKSLL